MVSPPSLLLVASDPEALRQLLAQFPRAAWKPMAARASAQVHKALQDRQPEVALITEQLEDDTGAALCAWIRAQAPDILLILLTQGIPPKTSPDDPWDAAIRHPTPPGVLADLVAARLRQRRQPQDHLAAFLQEIEARAQRMDQQPYHALLGLPEDAPEALVRQAYDALSLRFHPDRNLGLRASHPAHFAMLDLLYKRVGEAYRVLSHPERHARYARLLAQGELRYNEAERHSGPVRLEDLSENPRVKRFLKLAQASLDAANPRGALQNLRFALSMDPDNDDLKAQISALEASLA